MSLDGDNDRSEDRPEDREDDTDRAIRYARDYCIDAVTVLVSVMHDETASRDDRVRAATAVLEVAGCL